MPIAISSIRERERERERRIYLSIYLPGLHVKHVFIKALQIKTRRKFELRLSTSVHLLENLKQSNLTFSKTCAF